MPGLCVFRAHAVQERALRADNNPSSRAWAQDKRGRLLCCLPKQG